MTTGEPAPPVRLCPICEATGGYDGLGKSLASILIWNDNGVLVQTAHTAGCAYYRDFKTRADGLRRGPVPRPGPEA